jgi:chaperonin GroEL
MSVAGTSSMPPKQLLFRSEARAKLLRGATALAEAVRITLGPRSKSVLIAKKWGAPIVCNDGVTIAKELELKDLEEDLGVRTIRQAAERTGDAVGDGTSTATLLAHAIYADGVRNVEAGASSMGTARTVGDSGHERCTRHGHDVASDLALHDRESMHDRTARLAQRGSPADEGARCPSSARAR